MMKRLFCICLLFPLVFTPVRAREECSVCQSLAREGFPPSYRESLCALALSHPTWHFTPLAVTSLSRAEGQAYTFSFVLQEEVALPDRSLVTGKEEYRAYRLPSSPLFDTGYRTASREAVAYFLDPRNHLSERGVFQHLVLTPDHTTHRDAIATLFCGSSLEGCVAPEDVIRIGQEVGVDPLHLAVRLYQEHGSRGSPLLFGNTGSTLTRWYDQGTDREDGRLVSAPSLASREELLLLDGVYNPFHVSASGSGAFQVYRTGALHGKKEGWDSLEKGLRGGTEKIAREYIQTHQSTLYLQKWNVDIRSRTPEGKSRNFWAQYMQNIAGAKEEGDTLYSLYERMGLLEEEMTFLIPVYEGLPDAPSPDPAGGSAPRFAFDPCPVSSHLVSGSAAEEVTATSTTLQEENVFLPAAPSREEVPGAKERRSFFLFPVAAWIFFVFFAQRKRKKQRIWSISLKKDKKT